MTRSARDHVNSLLKKAQGDSDAQTDGAEPTRNEEHVGLYDLPPEDPRSREYVSGRRSSRSTERNVQYRAKRDGDEEKRRKSNDTRAKNASLRRARVEDPATQARPSESNHDDPGEVRPVTQRGRSHVIRALSHSPSLGSTDCEPEESTQAPGESQYTYKYETLDYDGLVNCAQEEFGLDVRGCSTQTIIDRIRLAAAEQASQVGSTRRSASIVMLPSTPFQVGGGWSQEVVGGSQSTGSRKRSSQVTADLSEGSSKRRRTEPLVDDDTATEPETDDEPTVGPELPLRGIQAPPNSRESTATTILDAQPSNASSHSLGGSLPPSRRRSLSPSDDQPPEGAPPRSENEPSTKRKLPRCIAPVCGPVHARLRDEARDRALLDVDRECSRVLSSSANNRTDEGQPADPDEVSETEFGLSTSTPHPAAHKSSFNSRTYRGHRSHIPSEPGSTAAKPTDASNAADEPSRPSSADLTASELIRRERARAVAAKVQEEMAEMLPRSRPRFATASQPPATRPQSRPPPRGSAADVQRVGGTSRRLDPVSAAREDMLAFNRAVAQGEATSFVESVTRQSERTARRAPPESRRPDELLDDDEEILAQAEAYAKRKWPRRPARPARPARFRKPKPLARDVSGVARQ
ncbi:hypothetical protein FRC11_004124, partial [Ceratobasidium sp. 423]